MGKEIQWEDQKRGDHLEDPDVDERVIFFYILCHCQ
jgi:hypothetical protein